MLSEDANGNMLVDNLGSSGMDGVRVAIPCALGASMELELDLGTNGEAWIHSDIVQQGVNNPLQVGLHLSADGTGEGAFLPDFSSLGFQTYNLRLMREGQVVQILTDLSGPTKMSNVPLQTIAEKVYVLPGDAGLPAATSSQNILVCVLAGGSSVTPPGGNVDCVTIEESQQEWLFTPDFSQLGSATYTLELYRQGQLMFQQSGMSGPAVSSAAFIRFYKKKTTHADGTVTTEWCIGGGSSSIHNVHGGPGLQADMFVLRSEAITPSEADMDRVVIYGGDLGGDITLRDAYRVDDCVGGSYCQSAPNTAGDGAFMCSSGSSSIGANDLVLGCTGLPTNQFGISSTGSGNLSVSGLDAAEFKVNNTGSGNLQLSGVAEHLMIRQLGSGNVNALECQSQHVEIDAQGSGDVAVNASAQLSVRSLGSGDVDYVGNPEVHASIIGSGDCVAIH